ncbi:Regulator of protease activity HflC, stomatin/prohibitin superfamily [Paraburkholderia megapolitana]|uniref:Regulator of protease activity HflC, stomatin/prohibitin superfamily n=2 Tax=Paraburkholderia megapolitana TaxID=420953 RepID=A0A1I3MPA4_9BURK|nr:Regulator of protease activity HflC, stomatin/prohibitin superfamily [Paraburkholderia megapolitana]
MPHELQGDNEHTHSDTVGAARMTSISLALAVLLGGLLFVQGVWFDTRWCAALSSAWFNVLAVALAARLANLGVADVGDAHDPLPLPRSLSIWRLSWWTAIGAAVRAALRAIRWQPLAVLACAALSVYMAWLAWNPPIRLVLAAALQPPEAALVLAVAALALAFGTLVAELFQSMRAERGRASASLANVLRVALAVALVAAASSAWLAYANVSSRWPLRIAAAFSAAIAIEFALRAVLSWFAPPRTREGDAGIPDSLLASLLRWRPSPLARFSTELRKRYGIDLRQNWVLLSFVRLLPAACVTVGVCAWLLTGIAILGPDQRAVYERFGAPVSVWQPGLHVGLPWPFGTTRTIDNGAVHQVVVSGSLADSSIAAPRVPADARTPEVFNRLWDVAHQGETSQVIAGGSGDRQNFQTVNADVRLDYRIGLSDAAARAALYRVADVPDTVRAIANREVVRYLASHTLESLLETRQTAMADSVKHAIQAQLDSARSGIDVVAVIIESVHPPAGASVAYHSVQAAQILAQASVAQASGASAQALGEAQQQAHSATARADAEAAEITSAARVQQTSFSADMAAAQVGGPAFAFEYYLHGLQKGLLNAHVTIIDDRLMDGNRATLDLRPYGPAAATAAADAAGKHRIY